MHEVPLAPTTYVLNGAFVMNRSFVEQRGHAVLGEQPKPIGTLTSETSMPRLSKRLANAELPAVVVLVQHAFGVEPDEPRGAGVATARIAREAATKEPREHCLK